jgi:uncharacterized linocin/CFP29 family protein
MSSNWLSNNTIQNTTRYTQEVDDLRELSSQSKLVLLVEDGTILVGYPTAAPIFVCSKHL